VLVTDNLNNIIATSHQHIFSVLNLGTPSMDMEYSRDEEDEEGTNSLLFFFFFQTLIVVFPYRRTVFTWKEKPFNAQGNETISS
jgi:hypothetical protein